ncbi:MAG: iron ABC transporter permease [Anaerolineae bacterium]
MQQTQIVRAHTSRTSQLTTGRLQAKRPSFSILQLVALVVALITLLPLGYLAIRGISAGTEGLDYLLSARTLTIIWNSIRLAAGVVISATVIGVAVAWITARTNLPYRRTWLYASLVPLVTPSFIGAMTFIAAFGPRGYLQQMLAPLGIERLPSIYGFFGAWFTITLFTYPYVLLPVRAALLNMDPALEETARSLGHNRWSVFWRITVPQLRPALATGILLTALYTLSDFGAVALMRYNAFTRAIFLQYTSSFDRNRAAILALVLVALALLLVAMERRIASNTRNYRVGGASTARSARPVELRGIWKVAAIVLLALIVTVGLVVPGGVLVGWLAQGLRANVDILNATFITTTLNTIGAGVITALIVGVVALPLAVVATRNNTRLNRWLVNAAYLGNSLPGLVVALALVFFAARYLPALYQTFAVLILGYTIRYLPLSIGATRSALTQINPRYEEAGRSLGFSPFQVNLRVTIPLVRTGIVGGMALVCLSVMKELPTTLLLAPTGFKTLTTEIWTAQNEAYLSQVGLPALLLIASSAVSLMLILRNETER